jgi:hypothetical protein
MGLWLTLHDGYTRLYRTWPLAALIAVGTTLGRASAGARGLGQRALQLVLKHGPGDDFVVPQRGGTGRAHTGASGGRDKSLSQPVTPTDIKSGRTRIPRDHTKDLFPVKAGEVAIVLRGTGLTASWNPRRGRHSKGGERSGQPTLDRTVLADLVDAAERLRLTARDDGISLD